MKLVVFLERGSPPRLNPIFAEAMALLKKKGIKCECWYPEEQCIALHSLRVDADLYLLKSDTELALSLASALEVMGANIINSARASQRVKNKVLAASVLHDAGIPAPLSLAASVPARLRPLFGGQAIIFKPYRGYHGVGLSITETDGELPAPSSYPQLAFAQTYLAHARKDLKVFVIGEQVFGVRKAFTEDSFLKVGTPTTVSQEIVDIALRCGEAFDMTLYGLDIAEDDQGLSVIDVNYVPGYRGVADAPRLLANHLLDALRGSH